MAIVGEHFREMLPIIYTPVVGHVIMDYCNIFKKEDDKGIVLTYFPPKDTWIDNHETITNYMNYIEPILKKAFPPGHTKKLLICTDATAILGIGD